MTDLFSKPQESEENIILHKLPSPINVLSWLLSPSFALFTEQFLMKTVFQNCCASLVLLLFHCLVSFTGYFSLQICIYFFWMWVILAFVHFFFFFLRCSRLFLMCLSVLCGLEVLDLGVDCLGFTEYDFWFTVIWNSFQQTE